MKFCIIGAGNGGRAFAVYLASLNHAVNLYNRSLERISDIIKKGGIKSTGEINGFFPLEIITQDIKLAVRNVDVVLVVTPASAHADIAREIAPYLSYGQIVLLNPGRTFGAVEFKKIIEQERKLSPVVIAETQTLLFTSRALTKNEVEILKIKNSVDFCAYPEELTDFVFSRIQDVFPQLNPVNNYLKVTLNNIGMLLHPTLSLLNASAMDSGRKFKFYKEGASPRSCKLLDAIELEINKVYQRLGLKQLRFCEWVRNSYGVEEESHYDAIQNIEAYKNIKAPKKLTTRYFTEDVPTGLVPIASLADLLSVDAPLINSIINLSSILCGIDFQKKGRTVYNLKLIDYIKEKVFSTNFLEIKQGQNTEMDT